MTRSGDPDHSSPSVENARRCKPQFVLSWRSCLEMISKVPMWVWNLIYISSSLIGVSADPLFFYVPFIDEENKCIGVDKKLRLAALIFRSLTDSTTLVYIMHHISKARKHEGSKSTGWNWNKTKEFIQNFFFQIAIILRIPMHHTRKAHHEHEDSGSAGWSWNKTKEFIQSFFFQTAIVLPIPQVLVLVLFFRMRGDKYFEERMVMNIFLLVQYIPRMYQIYLSSKRLTKQLQVGILAKGAFYLFMYILASHILGAFFYFLSIQRVTSCWHQTCRITGGCTTAYHCGHRTSVNITLLTELCPISPPNATLFDFGIFGKAIQSGKLELMNFSDKVFYFVWWGLRNLSNFGTNLETSSYLWENCFAILISVTGLLLFLYLIGNVQQCMQWEAEKDEVLKRFNKEKENIGTWMNDRNVDETLQNKIMEEVDETSLEKNGTDLDNLFSILKEDTRYSLKHFLSMKMLKNAQTLQGLNEVVLRSIIRCLEPVIYKDGSFFVTMGEPLDRFILVTDGKMLVYTSDSIHRLVEVDGVYGDEQLVRWVSSNSNKLTDLPISKENVKCITRVKGFVMRAVDFQKMNMYVPGWSYQSSHVKKIECSSTSTETNIEMHVDPTSFKG